MMYVYMDSRMSLSYLFRFKLHKIYYIHRVRRMICPGVRCRDDCTAKSEAVVDKSSRQTKMAHQKSNIENGVFPFLRLFFFHLICTPNRIKAAEEQT